jgi:hypothetical protein
LLEFGQPVGQDVRRDALLRGEEIAVVLLVAKEQVAHDQ